LYTMMIQWWIEMEELMMIRSTITLLFIIIIIINPRA